MLHQVFVVIISFLMYRVTILIPAYWQVAMAESFYHTWEGELDSHTIYQKQNHYLGSSMYHTEMILLIQSFLLTVI